MKRRITACLVAGLIVFSSFAFGGCGKNENNKESEKDTMGYLQMQGPEVGEEIAIIKTNMGEIKIQFFPEQAPKAVENFKTHAKEGYYNRLIFHRVINDFMIQGGDPEGKGTGGEHLGQTF